MGEAFYAHTQLHLKASNDESTNFQKHPGICPQTDKV
jgi:hypothetical protein